MLRICHELCLAGIAEQKFELGSRGERVRFVRRAKASRPADFDEEGALRNAGKIGTTTHSLH
jgi:hypothetical protein